MRGPCRVCVGGKVILIDEEGVWSERILCLKWSSVNTEIPKIEQRLEMEAKEEGEERQDMNGVFWGPWNIQDVSMKGLQRQGVGN